MSWCGMTDVARLHLVSRALRVLTLGAEVWSAIDVTQMARTDVRAFVKLFPTAFRSARSIRTALHPDHIGEHNIGFRSFADLAEHTCVMSATASHSGSGRMPNLRLTSLALNHATDATLVGVAHLYPSLAVLHMSGEECTLGQLQTVIHALTQLHTLSYGGALRHDPSASVVAPLRLPARLISFMCESPKRVADAVAANLEIEAPTSSTGPSQLRALRLYAPSHLAHLDGAIVQLHHLHILALPLSMVPSQNALLAIMCLSSLQRLSLSHVCITLTQPVNKTLRSTGTLRRLDLTRVDARINAPHLSTFFGVSFALYPALAELRVHADDRDASPNVAEITLAAVAASPALARSLRYLHVPAPHVACIGPPTDARRHTPLEDLGADTAGVFCRCRGSRCIKCPCVTARRVCGARCHGGRSVNKACANTSQRTIVLAPCAQIAYTLSAEADVWLQTGYRDQCLEMFLLPVRTSSRSSAIHMLLPKREESLAHGHQQSRLPVSVRHRALTAIMRWGTCVVGIGVSSMLAEQMCDSAEPAHIFATAPQVPCPRAPNALDHGACFCSAPIRRWTEPWTYVSSSSSATLVLPNTAQPPSTDRVSLVTLRDLLPHTQHVGADLRRAENFRFRH